MTLKQKTERLAIMTLAHNDHEKGLNLYAFYKTHNHEAGEDLVQDTFLKTWKYLLKGGKIDLMKSFLYHVLNNLIVDEYRKHKASSLDLLIEKGFEPKVSNIPTLDVLADKLDAKKIILLIKHLPIKYQKIMLMKYVKDLSLKEMSGITGETKNSIAVQLHRGLEKLKLLYIPA
ncbi:MAG: RNA polymerase sigma factor [Patescibacteria group bacterium]